MSKIAHLKAFQTESPTTKNRKVTRKPYSELRSREYLTPDEVNQLMASAKKLGRHGHRDMTAIMVAYRHALRVSELISLRWDMVAEIHCKALKYTVIY